jgi:hypothetical protein
MENPPTSDNWPFDYPKNQGAITTRPIFYEGKPILFVSHSEDGMWQFLDGETPRMEEAMVVSLHSMTQKDSSLLELADLPENWIAWRENRNDFWHREKE